RRPGGEPRTAPLPRPQLRHRVVRSHTGARPALRPGRGRVGAGGTSEGPGGRSLPALLSLHGRLSPPLLPGAGAARLANGSGQWDVREGDRGPVLPCRPLTVRVTGKFQVGSHP